MATTFYHAPMSRSTTIRALVHELGNPDDLEIVLVSIKRGDGNGQPDPQNPHPEGKAPFIVADGEMIRERVAIIAWLTERYPSDIAPLPGQKGRGEFLSWLAWYQGVMEPVALLQAMKIDNPGLRATFRDVPTAVGHVERALQDRDYLLGDKFSAADLIIAGAFAYFKTLTPETGPIKAWVERVQSRDSVRRAYAEDAELMAKASSAA